jgi:tetratricopeptide (TPR) repeat protein
MNTTTRVIVWLLSFAAFGCAHGSSTGTSPRHPDTEAQAADLSPEALASRGLSLMQQGDHLRAEQYLQLALRAGHADEPLIIPLLTTCIASSRFRAALMHADRHLSLHPEAWRVRFVRAAVLRALGQPEQAELERQRALNDAPTSAHARLAEGCLP